MESNVIENQNIYSMIIIQKKIHSWKWCEDDVGYSYVSQWNTAKVRKVILLLQHIAILSCAAT